MASKSGTNIAVRKSEERGVTSLDWLKSRHSFSFGHYHDPAHMGFRCLRVINDDIVAPGGGFETHGHRDMEIVTYVLSGALEHKDSLGNGSVILPGDVQRMSAGKGILHSEFNPSKTDPVHLLQIWILPEENGIKPSYEQKHFPQEQRQGKFCLIASQNGAEESVSLHQDIKLYAALLKKDAAAAQALSPGRYGYLHVARGGIRWGDVTLEAGDAIAISGEREVAVVALADSEILLFDLP